MNKTTAIKFEKASITHIGTIFNWLSEPHMMEFWDNSEEHKNDILNFIHNKPQTYFAGTTQYWIGCINSEPYAFVLSDILQKDQTDLSETHLVNMSETGHTIALDFGIGNKEYLGRGLAAPTLSEFMRFYKKAIDPKADTFFIDPVENNPRAIRVYNKAGFVKVGQYHATQGAFIGHNSDLMVKKLLD
jgi:RimJ/RimL family protein N-acetyltransferase